MQLRFTAELVTADATPSEHPKAAE
jgi:hypothetical protein